MLRGLGGSLAIVLASFASTSWADPSGAVSVRVEKGSPCIDQATLERGLFERIHRPRGSGGVNDANLVVRVTPRDGGFEARVRWQEPGETANERVLVAPTCAELALSVVLVSALAISSGDALKTTPKVTEPPLEPPNEAPEPRPIAPRSRIAAGFLVGLSPVGTDQLLVSGDGFVEVASRRSGFSPGVRVAVSYARTKAETGDVAIELTTFSLRAEPSLLRIHTARFHGAFATALEVGAAVGAASGVLRTASQARPWLRAGPTLSGSLLVASDVTLSADAGLLVAVVRDEFAVDRSPATLRVSPLAPLVRFGFSYQFR